MKRKVIVQNRHIQKALAAYETSDSGAIGHYCPLHQAIEEEGLIKGVFTVSTNRVYCVHERDRWFEPRLPEVLWTPSGWPTALVSGKEYVFEVEEL